MFDHIIVTSSNESQAVGYRYQTKHYKNLQVVSDPNGDRVGSLGSTVNVLKNLKLSGNVLICHSGGDAKRTPAYSAMGKVFIPVLDGRPILDHIIEFMEKLPVPENGGVFVVSGDTLLNFNINGVRFDNCGVTGIAYLDGFAQAQKHGVYSIDDSGKVINFLQKPNVTSGNHLIDTGIMFIDWNTANKMKDLPICGDIYDDFPKMLLNGFSNFQVNVVSDCTFFHVGSTREILNLLGDGNTYVDCVSCKLNLLGNNVVTNVPNGRFKTLTLQKGECLTCIPIGKRKWLDLYYNVDDNFKTDGLWEKYNLSDVLKNVNYERLLSLRHSNQTVRVTSPVRIDFSGGWSDTPPICYDVGGSVVNASITIDGKKPIEVVVKPRKDKYIGIISKDLHKKIILKSKRDILDHSNPSDWCCLVKSALYVTNFPFGKYGIDVIISADLPKGSGLGTSSILGACVISALLKTKDIRLISDLTLKLEQEMDTCGGWQDQYGGILGGFNFLKSDKGDPQIINIDKIDPNDSFYKEFCDRSLLYFTGQKRMARNILKKITTFYRNNPHNFATILIDSIKSNSVKCKESICSGNMDMFIQSINQYWTDKKLLDSGSTNHRVEHIIDIIKPYIDAVTLTGAGGGGFMYILAKSKNDVKKIKRKLDNNKISKYSKFYNFEICNSGIDLKID